jgi:hypothetical protein
MALRVQDDGGLVAGANGYVDLASFKGYHDDRGNSYAAHADSTIEAAIVRATDYLDGRFDFVGTRRNREQTTEWPRSNAWDRDRRLVTGVPEAVKRATCEYALRALATTLNPDPDRDAAGRTVQSKSEQVGSIKTQVEYVTGAALELPKYPAADAMLARAGLIRSGNTVARA